MEVNIVHLYYDILNLYGEYGNVVIMKKHLEDQGFKVNVDKKTIGDEIDFSKYQFVYMGCGTEKNLDVVVKDIQKYVLQINNAIENQTVFLATGNSFEMFGKKIDDNDAMAIFDYETLRLKDRVTSDVIYEPANDIFFSNIKNDDESTEHKKKIKVVGFVNKMTEMYHNMSPLFKVVFGIGENKNNEYEGVKYLNFYGTHISGPILTKNPTFLKSLVIEIGKRVDSKFKYNEKEYPYEEASYKLVLEELEKRNMER